MGIGLGLFILAALPSAGGLYLGVVVFAAGMAMSFPALLAFVVNRADPNDRAFVVASFSMLFDLAFALGAVIIGAAVALANERAGFAVGGLFALAGLLPLRSAARRNREPGALHRDRPPAVER
ncbi:MAG: MFS transporter [Actinomycetia bacterium]|nr:MFS transporter [Actinomycetes bacterium]